MLRWLVCLIVLGVAAPASAQIMTTQISGTSFGSAHVGTASTTTQTITISNDAAATAPLAFTVGGTSEYVAMPASGTVEAGASTQVVVTFTPSARGARPATLTVTGNDTANASDELMVDGTGTSGNLVINDGGAATIDFGQVAVEGAVQTRTFKLSNPAPANETLAFTVALASGGPAFVLMPPSTVALAVGESIDVTVTFDPTTTGAHTGSVTVTSDDAARPTATVTLAGQSVGAEYTPNLATLDFGTVPVGSFDELVLQITNTGNEPGTISSVTSGSSVFTVVPVGGALPRTLNPSEVLQLTVRFTPVDGSIVSSQLTFSATNAQTSPIVAVTGDGLYEDVSITAAGEADLMIDLGNRRVGVLATQAITVTNTGEAPATVSLPTSSATICAIQASGTTTFPAVLAPTETATFDIRVTPTAVGAGACTITVTTDIPTMDTISIDLAGVAPEVALLTPTTPALDFGVLDVDAPRAIRTVVLDNTGTAPLAIGPCTITGSPRFSVLTSCANLTVAADASATLMVAFDPMLEASETATLTISVDALSTSMIQLALSGIGADQRLDLSALSITFPDTTLNTGVPPIEYIEVRNPTNPATGLAETLSISMATSDNDVFKLANTGPFTVEAGEMIRLAVTFDPAIAGTYDGTLTIVSDASANPMAAIALHGRAIVLPADEGGGCCQSSSRSHAPLALVVLAIVCRRRRRG